MYIIHTHDNKEIILNENQEKAIYDFRDFLKSDKLFICLSGSAGTGKTTIAIEALKGQFGIIVTAPTHKAKKEISVKTGYEAKTIHSLCGLRPDMNLEEFNQRNLQFSLIGNDQLAKYSILCIDESSMLNEDLVDLIKDKAKLYNVKVLFMGDKMQLPPVREKISKVFNDEEIIQISLTKVERQKEGNPLFNLYDCILGDINTEKDLYKKETNINEKGEGYDFVFNSREFAEKIYQYFDNKSNSKIVAWTNDRVRQWNNFVRSRYAGSINAPLKEGEILMAYRSVYDDLEQQYIIYNSCEYIVEKVSELEKEDLKGHYVLIKDVDSDIVTGVFVLDQSDKESLKKFITKEQELANKAKSATKQNRSYLWKKYYQYRNKIYVVRDIFDSRGKVLIQKDFDFAYALTVHKSQGSTFENVFVDEVDINLNIHHYERNRLKYVALSRPTKMAIINSLK